MSAGFRATNRFRPLGAVDTEVGKPGSGPGPSPRGTRTGCNATYLQNHGYAPLNADLARLDPADLARHFDLTPGDLGVLISCAPCTGFSQKLAHNHAADDPRNHLIERTGLYVQALMPEFLVMENVKELLQGRHRVHFTRLAAHLERLGYAVSAGVYDFSRAGLPQRRRRAIIVARRGGPVPETLLPQFPEGTERTVRDTIAHLPPLDAGQADPSDPAHACPGMTPAVLERLRAIPRDGGSWEDLRLTAPHLMIPSMTTKRSGSFPDAYGRMSWDRPAPTITRECAGPGNGRYSHPEQDRLLSVREMALLQGFPADYTFCGTLAQQYNQIGNAVPPLIAVQLAERIGALAPS